MGKKEEQFIEMTGLLNEAIPEIKEVLESFNKQEDVPTEIAVYHSILERFYYCLQSVECLLHRFNNDVTFKFSIGLLIRNGLLDFITSGYLYEKGYSVGNFPYEFARVNHYFVNNQYNISQERRNNRIINQEEFQEELFELKNYFPENFLSADKNSTPKLKKDINSISPREMAKNLINHSDVYALYDYYSQYEHYGVFSKHMLDGRPEYDFDKLKVALMYTFLGIILCFDILRTSKDKSAEIKKIWDKIMLMPELCANESFLSPPGDTLLETIEALAISKTELAKRMNCPLKLVQEIIKGEAPITPEIALQLESILNVPATFWLERERRYRMRIME